MRNDSNSNSERKKAAASAVGGATIGAVTSHAVGGMGLAVGGTGLSVGAAPVIAAGAVIGFAAYSVYRLLRDR